MGSTFENLRYRKRQKHPWITPIPNRIQSHLNLRPDARIKGVRTCSAYIRIASPSRHSYTFFCSPLWDVKNSCIYNGFDASFDAPAIAVLIAAFWAYQRAPSK